MKIQFKKWSYQEKKRNNIFCDDGIMSALGRRKELDLPTESFFKNKKKCTTLLRFNSRAIRFTHLKCINSLKYILSVVQPSLQSVLEHFH